MKVTFEKLELALDQSFRCFDRRINRLPARWHRHPELELTYVPSGNGSRLIGDSLENYEDHDLVLMGSNLAHVWSSDEYRGMKLDMHEAIVTQFSMNCFGDAFFELAEMEPIRRMLCRSKRGIHFEPEVAISVASALRALTKAKGPSRIIGLLSVLDVLAESTAWRLLATAGYTGPISSVAESRIQRASDLLHTRFMDPDFTTGEIAKELKMNASAFSRFFRQSTGQTPSAYLNELRVGCACRLLADSNRSILDICFESGFASTSNFHVVFKKSCGMSPREYRSGIRSLESDPS